MKFTSYMMLISLGIIACHGCTTDDDILIDIMFVVDGSGSIGLHHFEIVKEWLVNATTAMSTRFGRRALYGVLEYSNHDPPFLPVPIEQSNKFEIPFRLGGCSNTQCMKNAIMSMKYLEQQTFTSFALRRVLEVEFPLSPNADISKKAIILLTDGAANDATDLPNIYLSCVDQGITNFAVGVANYRIEQLRLIANGGVSNARVFVRPDFESLSTVLQTLEADLEDEGFFCDECASETDSCSEDATCINHVNGFDCVCNSGYIGDGHTCEDINECLSNPCQKSHTNCINGDDRYECVCQDGFLLNGEDCEDTDECASNPCEFEFSHCLDEIDGYICACDDGRQWNNKACVDPSEFLNTLVMTTTYTLAGLISLALIIFVIRKRSRDHKYRPELG